MKRCANKAQRDGWRAAQSPDLVAAPVRERHVSPEEKQREAARLAAEVEAHIAAGGVFERL